MMLATLLKAETHRQMPWKNGGGVTVEIAIYPEDASVDDFDWRVSTASVAQDGAFSKFENVDRTLSVLSGDALVLEVEDKVVQLSQQSQPFSFAADATTYARLTGGAITDLNVMTRRGHFIHQVHDLRITGAITQILSSATCLIYCGEGALTVQLGTECWQLSQQDCLVLSDPAGSGAMISGAGRGFLISLERVV